MPYLRRPDLSVFSRVSLHSFFSSTVPPYPFSNTSPIFIYVDSSIRSYVANTSVFFQRKPTHVNLSSLHGKDPPFKYRLPPYGVFSTSRRVAPQLNGRTQPLLSAALICFNVTTDMIGSPGLQRQHSQYTHRTHCSKPHTTRVMHLLLIYHLRRDAII